jgi:hypothetical protein
MRWLRRHYGAGPLHLLGLLACFGVAAYAVTRVLGEGGWTGVLLWFVVCVVLHDLIGWPVYALADRMLVRAEARHRRRYLVPWTNHIRFPTVISAVLLGMFFPLIFRISNATYVRITALNENVYLINWLVVTGILFGGSAVTYVLRLVVARRRSRHPLQPIEGRLPDC